MKNSETSKTNKITPNGTSMDIITYIDLPKSPNILCAHFTLRPFEILTICFRHYVSIKAPLNIWRGVVKKSVLLAKTFLWPFFLLDTSILFNELTNVERTKRDTTRHFLSINFYLKQFYQNIFSNSTLPLVFIVMAFYLLKHTHFGWISFYLKETSLCLGIFTTFIPNIFTTNFY